MATYDEIREATNTGSSAFEMAPAVLYVLNEAGARGLQVSAKNSAVARVVRQTFGIARGTHRGIIGPSVTYLVKIGCIREKGEQRFITPRGRNLLRKPLPDIYRAAREGKLKGRPATNAIFPGKRGRPPIGRAPNVLDNPS